MELNITRHVKSKAAEEKRKLQESEINGLPIFKSNLDDLERRVISITTPDVVDGDGKIQEKCLDSDRPAISFRDILYPQQELSILESDDINAKVYSIKVPTETQPGINRPKRRISLRSTFNETHHKLDAYLKFEKEKLIFEKEKFKFKQKIETQMLAIEARKAAALELIGQSLITITYDVIPN